MLSQKQAVFNAVTSALQHYGVSFVVGMDVNKAMANNKDLEKLIIAAIASNLKNNEVNVDIPLDTDEEYIKFAQALLRYWLTNDSRFVSRPYGMMMALKMLF